MEYEKELIIGSQDDMLSNAQKSSDKTLTLKSLEKRVNDFIKNLKEQIEVLDKKIETIKKSLKR